tara:strand:+ start:290 stop:598 length:309 start_codon:yes stop_codon:yes gene_type:complete
MASTTEMTLAEVTITNNLSSDTQRVALGGTYKESQSLVKTDESQVVFRTEEGWSKIVWGGVLPTLTTTERNALSSPVNGMVIYNSTTHKAQIRANGSWADLH